MKSPGARLETIAGHVVSGEVVADIGSDHGFLPLYLAEGCICSRIIVTDISGASLNKAMAAFESYGGGARVEFRLGDGLSPLERGEADAVVMAGMGGVLITRILGKDTEKTVSFGKFILQPRNGAGKLRFWLKEAGFSIEAEDLAPEGGFICEILTARPPDSPFKAPSLEGYEEAIENELPLSLTDAGKEMYAGFLSRKISRERRILDAMRSGGAADKDRIRDVKGRLDFLSEAYKEVSGHDEV